MFPGSTGRLLALAAATSIVLLFDPTTPSEAQSPSASPDAPLATPAAAASYAAPLGGEIEALRESIAVLSSRIDDLSGGTTPPPWASSLVAELDARIERLMEMQERLAARIETPLPRLDEPIILFTVAASTLVLGFVVGRGIQRRRDRRDGRFRL